MSPSVLVVDDNEANRDLLSRRLGKRGYQVTAVEDGFQALDALQTTPYDLVILDILMPGLSGLDVLRALRQDHPPSALPVIMATARDETEDMLEAMSLGATDYVTKPINLPMLLARIEAQLSMRKVATPSPQSAVADLKPGSVLDGRYALLDALGEGGFSVVYRARQVSTGQEVAIKLIRPDLAAGSEDAAKEAERFQHEMQVIGRLRHPHIVRLIDCGALRDGHFYTVLEMVEGESLDSLLRRHGALRPSEAQRLMGQVLDALSCAHAQGVIHLDLKPQNIMVVSTGARRSALVLDFGLAAIMEQGEARLRELRGTPAYMSPEHLRRQALTPKCDLYAWGLIFIECLTGKVAIKHPSRGGTILEHLSERPVTIPNEIQHPELRRLLTRALAKAPEARYGSAALVMAELEQLGLDDRATTTPRLRGQGSSVSSQSSTVSGAGAPLGSSTHDVVPGPLGPDSDTAPLPDDD